MRNGFTTVPGKTEGKPFPKTKNNPGERKNKAVLKKLGKEGNS